jgi:hypothetical protein
MMPGRVICFIIFFLSHFLINVVSQLSGSPYTLFGAGQIQDYGFGTNRGMGGTGIALKSEEYLNNLNPASYSGIDSLNFIFEFGLFNNITRYKSFNMSQTKINGNIRYLAIGMKVWHRWAVSAGIIPYSSVGYHINSREDIEGLSIPVSKIYSGSGGINQAYFGNALLVGRNLSLGVNMSYLFGNITQSEEVEENDYFDGYIVNNRYYMNNFHMDYGLQYTFAVNHIDFSVGAIFGNEKKLNTRNEVIIEIESDTIALEKENCKFYIPARFGIGLAIAKTEKFKVGIDYEFNRWADYKFSNSLLTTRNSERFAAGMEYYPAKGYKDRGLKLLQYRAGLNFSKSYLVISRSPLNSTSLSLGLGIPLKNQLSHINLSFEAGEYGTLKNKLIRERYLIMHINLTLRDRWFERRKYY